MPLHTPETQIEFSSQDFAAGVAQLARYKAGQTRGSYAEHMSACMVLASQTEFLTQLAYAHKVQNLPADASTEVWVWEQICINQQCVIGGSQERADAVGFGKLYAATQQVIRDLVNGSRTTGRRLGGGQLPPGGVEDSPALAFPAIPVGVYYAVTIIGSLAVAGYTWWSVDKNEQEAEVEKHSANLAAQLAQYQAWLDDNYRRGEPPPPAPPFIDAAAMQDKQSNWWALAAGALVGGLAVVGITQAMKTPTYRRARRRMSNPRRRPALPASTPKKKTKKRNPKKKTKKSNPSKQITVAWGALRDPDGGWRPQFWISGRNQVSIERGYRYTKKKAEDSARAMAEVNARRLEKKHGAGSVTLQKREFHRKRNPHAKKKKTAKKAGKRRATVRKKAPRKRNPKRSTSKRNPKRVAKKKARKKAPPRKRNVKRKPSKKRAAKRAPRRAPKRGFPGRAAR